MSFLQPKQEKRVVTVTQITARIISLFQREHEFADVSVCGEIGTCNQYSTGTVFFTLKDSRSAIPCVMFGSNARKLPFELKAGMEVIVHGNIAVYQKEGKYQLYADKAERQGKGKLYEKFEEIKKRLETEGLFDPGHKKEIPAYARKIGVVTSRTGAVIHDIESVSARRNPYVQILLFPAQVQGREAVPSLIRGLEFFEKTDVDTVIIGRGGGSIEDLWEFNSEELARAIYRCRKPVISAVGHESDFTIADFAADRRAATPTEAAELAVFEYSKFADDISKYHAYISREMNNIILGFRNGALKSAKYLQMFSPQKVIDKRKEYISTSRIKLDSMMKSIIADRRMKTERTDQLGILMKNIIMNAKIKADESERLGMLMRSAIADARIKADVSGDLNMLMKKKIDSETAKLKVIIGKMEGLSPLYRLDSGYSYVSTPELKNINTIEDVKKGDNVLIFFKDGCAGAEIKAVKRKNVREIK